MEKDGKNLKAELHYNIPISPLEFIIKNKLGFCEGNIIKYICRYKQKEGIRDLEKAKHYINILIEQEKEKEEKNGKIKETQ